MPIYEYQCGACGHKLEAIQKMTDEPLTACPICHKASLQKMVSAAGFQLKGTGWYATDFKNKGKKPEAKSDDSSGGNQEKKDNKTDKNTTNNSTDTAAK